VAYFLLDHPVDIHSENVCPPNV